METKQIPVDGIQINLVDQGSGLPILLIHGFPLDHSMWVNQIWDLSSDYRVIAPDLPGFGSSESFADSFSLRGCADLLDGLLTNLKVEQSIVCCGLSMGGYIGWQFWKYHTHRVRKIVACDTRAANDSQQVARARRISAESVLKTGANPVADAMTKKLFYEKADPNWVTQVHGVIAGTKPESIAAGQLAMANRPDATPWLSEISVPSLFVCGEHDEITTPKEMAENADLVKDSALVKIAGAGHMAPLENGSQFNAELRSFLEVT